MWLPPSRALSNTICDPSADQEGPKSPCGCLDRFTGFEPLADIAKISEMPVRVVTIRMRDPSGDHSGTLSSCSLVFVRLMTLVPSTFITKSSPDNSVKSISKSRSLSNTILLPSFDKDPPRAKSALFVTFVTLLPSAFMMKMSIQFGGPPRSRVSTIFEPDHDGNASPSD